MLAKVAVEGLGANKTEKAIIRVGKAIGTMSGSLENFDAVNNVPKVSGAHSCQSSRIDLHKVVKQLVKSEVVSVKPDWKHKSFPNIRTNCIQNLSKRQLKEWLLERHTTGHFKF